MFGFFRSLVAAREGWKYARWEVIGKKLEVEEEVEKSFASRNWVCELWRPNEYYGSARGIYTRMVTCPFNFGQEPIESFDERIESR